MSASFTFESQRFSNALRAFMVRSRRDVGDVLKQQAKLLVQEIYRITPPNSASTGVAAGKNAVRTDIFKVLRNGRSGRMYGADPAAMHKRFRRSRGRVHTQLKQNGKDRRIRVTRSVLAAYIKQQQDKVGWLSAGWNASASRLGSRVPAVALRHGSGKGSINIRFSGPRMSIELRNEVRFASDVKDFQRRVNFALGSRAGALERQMASLMRRGASTV